MPKCDHPTSNDLKGSIFDILAQIFLIHQNGYVHCDINETNFIKDEMGKVLLCDFETIMHVGETRTMPSGKIGFSLILPETAAHFRDDLIAFKNVFLYAFTIKGPEHEINEVIDLLSLQ